MSHHIGERITALSAREWQQYRQKNRRTIGETRLVLSMKESPLYR
jgi:hypothetical protein